MTRLASLWIILVGCVLSTSLRAGEPGASPIGCYISTGDNDWLWESPPTQSAASIRAVFTSLNKLYGCDRMYWRGIQSEIFVDHFLLRPESLMICGFWDWERHLAKEAGTSRIAVKTAHELGMSIWGFTGLFEHGAQAEADSAKGFGPSPVEDRLRVEHPEWSPVDRCGIRRQAGPVEFAYPEARKALVQRYAEAVSKGGYDGIMFYTYVEHFTLRFEDEFGYNDPIVAEFKKRYGVDIRTEPFDKQAWHRLRGEYVTQFLRELKAELQSKGKELGVAVDPQDPHHPAPWLCVRTVRPTGLIYLDWERWVREGIVDEIMVYCNGSQEAALDAVLSAVQGTPCRVSAIHALEFAPALRRMDHAGVRKVVVGSSHWIECGYPQEQPPEALSGDDPFAKMRVLEQITEGKTQADLAQIIKATKDTDVLVRRQAVKALSARTEPEALAAIEAALDDPEHPVRCAAAAALSRLNGPESVKKLFAAVKAHGNFQFDVAVTTALSRMKAERTADILEGAADKDPRIRRVAVLSLRVGESRAEALPVLLKALSDPDDLVRFGAVAGLARSPESPGVAEGLLRTLSDSDPTVRSLAAKHLVIALRSKGLPNAGPMREEACKKLTELFGLYREGYKGADADWGHRPIGDALLVISPRGKEALEGFLRQREDLRLAGCAWEALYVRQSGYTYCLTTEAEAAKGCALYPRLSGPAPVPQKPAK